MHFSLEEFKISLKSSFSTLSLCHIISSRVGVGVWFCARCRSLGFFSATAFSGNRLRFDTKLFHEFGTFLFLEHGALFIYSVSVGWNIQPNLCWLLAGMVLEIETRSHLSNDCGLSDKADTWLCLLNRCFVTMMAMLQKARKTTTGSWSCC